MISGGIVEILNSPKGNLNKIFNKRFYIRKKIQNLK